VTRSDPRRVADLFARLRARGDDTWDPPAELLGDDAEAVLLALRALTIQADAHVRTETRVNPAVTSPGTSLRARRINAVLDELLLGARQEIVVLGYELSDRGVLDRLADRSSMGVRVELLLDSVQTPLPAVAAAWPVGSGSARVWRTSVDGRGRPIRLHAKAVIADGRRALVGSANFTRSGLRSNLELGVILDGPAVAVIRTYTAELIARQLVVDAGEVGGRGIERIAVNPLKVDS
jgi:phosphatidylserine/phosphatidylglycerophosphate/cardiolipin synthase-like enzyme